MESGVRARRMPAPHCKWTGLQIDTDALHGAPQSPKVCSEHCLYMCTHKHTFTPWPGNRVCEGVTRSEVMMEQVAPSHVIGVHLRRKQGLGLKPSVEPCEGGDRMICLARNHQALLIPQEPVATSMACNMRESPSAMLS